MTIPSQAVSFHLGTREVRDCPLEEVDLTGKPDSGNDPERVWWFHLDSLDPATLQKVSGLLALPDELLGEMQSTESLPHVMEDEDSLTLVTHYWKPPITDQEAMEPRRLIIHLTHQYCLTVASDDIPALQHFAATYRREFRFAKTVGFILFLILDNLVDDFTKMLREMDDRSEDIDEKIHRHFSNELNNQILDLRRSILTLKRFAASLRDSLMRLSGRRIPVISEACRQSLGDVYNHAQVVVNQLESLRELVASSLESYNAILAQKMNETMKVLTLFASIVLPMSLIAGIYGMNFRVIPELNWSYGYFFALGLMILCATTLLYFFKRKRWF